MLIKRLHLGIITATLATSPAGRERWELRYRDPLTGKDVLRRIYDTEDGMKKVARHIQTEIYQGRGYLAGKPQAPLIKDALAQAMRLSQTGPTARKDMAYRSTQFLTFLTQHYPAIQTFDQLKPSMLRDYVQDMQTQNLAYDTIRLRLAVVRQAWRLMADDHPDLVHPLPRTPLGSRPRPDITCLTLDDAHALLDYLRDDPHAHTIYPLQLLAATCGLRQLEAAALREQDIDFDKSTLTVTKTPHHTPKNQTSYRTLPVPQFVLDALKTARDTRKVIPLSGELFLSSWARPWKVNTLSQAANRYFKAAALALDKPQLAQIPAKKLRATFATATSQAGADRDLVKAYMGHTPADILGGHYRQISPEELATLPTLITQLWTPTPQPETETQPNTQSEAQ